MIIILFVCSLVTLIENEIFEDKDFTRTIVGIITGCSMIAMFLMIAYLCNPRVINDYRDKTTPPTPLTPTTTPPTTHTPPTTTPPTTTPPTTLEITYFEFN